MNKKIFEWPSKHLSNKAKSVSKEDIESIKKLEIDLIDTCNINMGVGLAASQIGVHKRVIIIKPGAFNADNIDPSEYNEEYMILINPVLEYSGKKIKWKEACLSLPMTSGGIERFELCKVTYMNLNGDIKSFDASWPFSGGLQHECDHLDGILYISRQKRANRHTTLEKLKRNRKKIKTSMKGVKNVW